MAFPKKEIFPIEDQQLSGYGRAIAHPARVFILPHLLINDEMCVKEIEKLLGLSQPAVSDHLSILRETHFIDVECRGRYNFYKLNTDQLRLASTQIEDYFQLLFGNATHSITIETKIQDIASIFNHSSIFPKQ